MWTQNICTEHPALTSCISPASQHEHRPGADSLMNSLSPGHECERDLSHLRSQRWKKVALRTRARRSTEPLGLGYIWSFQGGSDNFQHGSCVKYSVQEQLRGSFQVPHRYQHPQILSILTRNCKCIPLFVLKQEAQPTAHMPCVAQGSYECSLTQNSICI